MLHRLSERFEMIVRSASEIRVGNDQEMIFTRKDSPDGLCWSVQFGDFRGYGKYDDRDLAETIEDMIRGNIYHIPRIMIGGQEFFKVYHHMFGDFIISGYGTEVWRYGEPICDLWEEFYWFSARPNYKVWSVLSGGTEMRFVNTYNIPTEPRECTSDVFPEYAFVVDGDTKWLVDKPTLMWYITYTNSTGGTITAETGDGNIIPCKPPKNVKELYGKDPSKHFDRLSNAIAKKLEDSHNVIVEYDIDRDDGPQRVYFNRNMGSGKDMWRLHERYNVDEASDCMCSTHRVVSTIAHALSDNWEETERILVDGVPINELLNGNEVESTEDVVRYLVEHTPHIELISTENDERVRYILTRRSPDEKWLIQQTDPPIHIIAICEIDDLVDQIMSRLNDERYIYRIFGVSIQERIMRYRGKRR